MSNESEHYEASLLPPDRWTVAVMLATWLILQGYVAIFLFAHRVLTGVSLLHSLGGFAQGVGIFLALTFAFAVYFTYREWPVRGGHDG